MMPYLRAVNKNDVIPKPFMNEHGWPGSMADDKAFLFVHGFTRWNLSVGSLRMKQGSPRTFSTALSAKPAACVFCFTTDGAKGHLKRHLLVAVHLPLPAAQLQPLPYQLLLLISQHVLQAVKSSRC